MPFIVGAAFVLVSVLFIALSYNQVKHVDRVQSAH